MKYFVLFCYLFLSIAQAEEQVKIDLPGCPENAICDKATGEHRLKWLEILTKLEQKKINEVEANKLIQKNTGFPIPVWAMEFARKKPLVMLWDSPCKQHNIDTNKTYIGVTFIKKMMEKNNILFHPIAILLDEKKDAHSLPVLRGDAPLFIVNDSLYYTEDDDGHYYGLLISPKGQITLSKVFSDTHYPRETACTKEQIDRFTREAPSPNFFKGYYCKEIWNTQTKFYESIILGWSCN